MREGGGVVQLLGHPLPCHQVRHEDLVVFVLVSGYIIINVTFPLISDDVS